MSSPDEPELTLEQDAALATLWRNGFVRIGNLWTKRQTQALVDTCSRLMTTQPIRPWNEKSGRDPTFRLPIFEDKTWAVLSNLSGLDTEFDEFLEGLLTHPFVSPLLEAIVGKDFKIWETGIRRAQISDRGLALHQDSVGEFGLSVLLADIDDMAGTTVFFKGSHRFRLSSVASGIDQFAPNLMQPFLAPAAGKAGDVFLFFKNTWHGRLACNIPVPKDAMLMSFIASGYDYSCFDVPEELLSRLPPVTAAALNPRLGTRLLPNGRHFIERLKPHISRLIDKAYSDRVASLHPSQALHLAAPFGKIKRWARNSLNTYRRGN